MKAVEFSKVWEKYHIKFIEKKEVRWEEIWALEDVSFSADKGEVLGIIGQNGSGKTTILKLISGMLVADKGEAKVNGRVSALMELGAGFKQEFSGRENIKLNARAYGLSEENLDVQIEKIIEFADIGRFIDAPIKYYSQGMYARLAFALAIFVEPDILLIDDIMAVGDEEAQQKCIKKIFELKQSGKTIVLVSHDMSMINKLCNRVLLVENGRIIQQGRPGKVTSCYLETVGDKKGIAVVQEEKLRLVFNNGRLSLSRDGFFATKDMGIYAVFFDSSRQNWVFSYNLYWSIKQQTQAGFTAEGRDSKGELFQSWQVCFENTKLQCRVQLNSSHLKEARLEMSLTPEYKTCASLLRECDFPAIIHKSSWQEAGPNDFPESILGMYSDESFIPGIILKGLEGQALSFKVFNTGYEKEARIVQIPLTRSIQNSISLEIFSEAQGAKARMKEAYACFKEKKRAEEEKNRFQRTISFKDFSLFADIENKALRLYHRGLELTKGNGLHASFLAAQAWGGTERANWQVMKENNCLLVKFAWEGLDFVQECRFYFKDSALAWDSQCRGRFSPDLFKIGLALDEAYQSFFCGSQQADFPEEFTSWKDMFLEEPKAEFLGLKAAGSLAAVTLENKDSHCCIIQNSDKDSSCRVLQLALPKGLFNKSSFSFSTRIGLFEKEVLLEDYIRRQKQESLAASKQKHDSRNIEHTVSSGPLKLFADVDNRSLRVFYQGNEVTAARGLCSAFGGPAGSLLEMFNAEWKVHKASEQKLVVTLEYESFPGAVVWSLKCCPDGSIDVKIDVESSESIHLTKQEIKLELADRYKEWKTTAEKGNFIVDEYIKGVGPVRLKDNKVSAVVLEPQDEVSSERLSFECLSGLENRVISIYKRKDEKETCAGIYSSAIVPKRKQQAPAGKYTVFEGKVAIGKDAGLKNNIKTADDVILSSSDLKFIFDRGRAKIFRGRNELTKELGLYTSIRSQGIWYDSYQACWQLVQKQDKRIVVSGDWPHIPVSQEWQAELSGENLILWQVYMEISEEFDLEIAQSNIMLSSQYKNWQAAGLSRGEFTDEYTLSYDILPFRFFYGRVSDIEVKGQGLPKLTFKNTTEDEGLRAIVENTDSLYKARLIQYQKTGSGSSLSAKALHFKGEIRVEA